MSPADGPLPQGAGWVAEPKMDGWRALVRVRDDGSVAVTSRRGRPLADVVPDLVAGLEGCPPVVLDGELVAYGGDGRPDFYALRAAVGQRPAARLAAFDVLELAGRVLLDEPWSARRSALEGLQLPTAVEVVPVGEVHGMWAATFELGLEGVVCKRTTSRYLPGARSRLWVRRKHWTTTELLVFGYAVEAQGARLFTSTGSGVGIGVVGLGVSRAVVEALAALPSRRGGGAVWFDEPPASALVRHHGDARRPRDAQCLALVDAKHADAS